MNPALRHIFEDHLNELRNAINELHADLIGLTKRVSDLEQSQPSIPRHQVPDDLKTLIERDNDHLYPTQLGGLPAVIQLPGPVGPISPDPGV